MLKRVLLAIAVLMSLPLTSQAQAITDQTQMVNRAVNTVERIRSDPKWRDIVPGKLANARAVLIVPDLVKGGFFLGAEYGTGVLVVRGNDGTWSAPAFYSIASGSFGLQIGLQDAESLFIIMSDRGLSAIMQDKMKLGAAADIAVTIVGAGAEADTTTHAGADIFAFSSSAGLYAGVTLAGSGIVPRHAWNAAYYSSNPSPEDIVLTRRVDNPQDIRLKDILGR